MPGDKSISHRYAILASLAEGHSELEGFSSAADCASTLSCLERLGIEVERNENTDGRMRIGLRGTGLNGLRKAAGELDAGNSGTTMRMLAGVLVGQPFDSKLTGDASLCKRPMRRVIEPLALMGAEIRARESNFAPLEIQGARLQPIRFVSPVASAQVKSAILLAGLFCDGETSVEEPACTRDHTEIALTEFGADIRREGRLVSVQGRPHLEARKLKVPGDLSSAVFFLAAASLVPDSDILIRDVGLNPTRSLVLDIFARWGAQLTIVSNRNAAGEPMGDANIRYAPLKGGVLCGPEIALLIDELPMLAALGPYTERGVEIHDAAELRVKESDRIAVVCDNLRRMGAVVEERPDGLRVDGMSAGRLHGAEIDPHGDHRIAMAFAVAALGAEGPSVILDSECSGVSNPAFFSSLGRITASKSAMNVR